MLRTYRGNAARLADLARQTLVFESLGALARGLRVVAADTDVQVVSVKNRYAASYNAAGTAGYRNVALGLRFVCPTASSLGVLLQCTYHLALILALCIL